MAPRCRQSGAPGVRHGELKTPYQRLYVDPSIEAPVDRTVILVGTLSASVLGALEVRIGFDPAGYDMDELVSKGRPIQTATKTELTDESVSLSLRDHRERIGPFQHRRSIHQ